MDREKVIRIIDELIFEAQKKPTWKAENALRCLKKELLKEQEVETYSEQELVRCKDCAHAEKAYDVYLCGTESDFGRAHTENWFCADGKRRDADA